MAAPNDIYQCPDRPNLPEQIQDEKDQINYENNSSEFDFPSLLAFITAIILLVLLFVVFNKSRLNKWMLLILLILLTVLSIIIIRQSWSHGKYTMAWITLIIFVIVASLAIIFV